MHLLMFLHRVEQAVPWLIFLCMLLIAATLVFSTPVKQRWLRNTLDIVAVLFAVLAVLIASLFLLFGSFHREQTTIFKSPSGNRVALLNHAEDRDTSGSRVIVKVGCCRSAVVYEYSGYDSDYLDSFEKAPVEWIDDSHLVIRYVEAGSSLPKKQVCHKEHVTYEVLCEVQPYPHFPYQPKRKI